ncbi:hypothetical protein ACP70R_000558 [Stipagrostis hirtigluma subsp. patula]
MINTDQNASQVKSTDSSYISRFIIDYIKNAAERDTLSTLLDQGDIYTTVDDTHYQVT